MEKSDKQKKLVKLIKGLIGDYEKERISSIELNIKEIDCDEAYEFENAYHLQNSANSKFNIGAFYKDELIGVMTFGKPRFNNNYEYELIRLCWKPDVSVVGGTEKLFKYFTTNYNPQSIITYTDISKFTGNVYTRLGFKPIEPNPITEPNYVWVDNTTNLVLTKYQTQKYIVTKEGLWRKGQVEDEIMSSLNFVKIYDSGNIRLEWKEK